MWLNSELLSLGLVYMSSFFYKGDEMSTSKAEDRGFGEDISWTCMDKCVGEAQNLKLPVMLIIHKSWCRACKALKPKIAASKEIKELSENFVMVNVMDDEEPKDRMYAPDGSYIPRILFLNPQGDVMAEFYNDIGNPKFKYFYTDSNSIVRQMKKVSQEYPPDINHPNFNRSDLDKPSEYIRTDSPYEPLENTKDNMKLDSTNEKVSIDVEQDKSISDITIADRIFEDVFDSSLLILT